MGVLGEVSLIEVLGWTAVVVEANRRRKYRHSLSLGDAQGTTQDPASPTTVSPPPMSADYTSVGRCAPAVAKLFTKPAVGFSGSSRQYIVRRLRWTLSVDLVKSLRPLGPDEPGKSARVDLFMWRQFG